ncbi:MAG: DNA repair protein RadC [Polyangiaceae bacterium]|nr:DNA repair protein RadC [Polyangiaceae bacterium]
MTTTSPPSSMGLPRERALAFGIAELADLELLAIVLGTGAARTPVVDLAARVMSQAGGLVGLARSSPAWLSDQPGIGQAKALRICAGFELARRAAALEVVGRTKLASSSDVAAYARARLGTLTHEEMWVLALDGQNGARAFRRVAQGGLHGCSVSARDILRVGLQEAASAIVLVHNHPSGDPTPSAEDIAMTRVLAEAADIVGIALVDHVVVAHDSYASLLDLGLLP